MTHPQIAPKYRLDGIVATVDMAAGLHTLMDHKEAVKQAAVADVLLLTKSDLATVEQRDTLLAQIEDINPSAPRWEVSKGEIAANRVLDLGLFSASDKLPDVARWLKEEAYAENESHDHEHHRHDHDHVNPDNATHTHDHHGVNRHDSHIRSFCFTIERPIPDQTLAEWLELLMSFIGSRILRVKGILNIEGNEKPVVVHGVQHIFHPPVTLPAWPNEDRRSRLVFITYDVDKEVIEKTFYALAKGASD